MTASSPLPESAPLTLAELPLPAEADDANDIFEAGGLGRLVQDEQPNEMLLEARVGRTRVGVVYVCAPVLIGYALTQAGVEVNEAASAAMRLRAVEGIAVLPSVQGTGIGGELLAEVARRLRDESDADFLVAKVDVLDLGLQRWYRRHGFDVGAPGQSLLVDGHAIAADAAHVHCWMAVSDTPGIDVRGA